MERYSTNEHGGNVWAVSARRGSSPDGILDFSANINPLGPSPKALQAIREGTNLVQHYPEPRGDSLKRDLAAYLDTSSANLILANGGSELIYLLGRMFYHNRVLLLAPSFSEYGAGLNNPKIEHVMLDKNDNFKLPLEKLLRIMRSGDLIFIGNPNNPTGNLFESSELLEIIQAASRRQAAVVVDEAFLDFVDNIEHYTMRRLVEETENLVVISSLTKFFAIPGLRLGYALARPSMIDYMERLLPPWRINTLALLAGRASLQDEEYIHKTVRTIRVEREYLSEGLAALKAIKLYPSLVNFILLEIKQQKCTAEELRKLLESRGIMIRSCANFLNLSPYFFRVAVKSRNANQCLINELRSIFYEDNHDQTRGDQVEPGTKVSGP